jgi:molybdopterin converting factor small subunit
MLIKYISWLPGIIGIDQEEINMPENDFSLENLMDLLAARKGRFEVIFRHKNTIFASRNGQVIESKDLLKNSDSITFFSPIAGG